MVEALCLLRWPETDGRPVCPACGYGTPYNISRPGGAAPRWRCKSCRRDFSITSGTVFAFRKMPLRAYLHAMQRVEEGVPSLRSLAQEMGANYRTAHFLVHRLGATRS